MGMDSVFKVSLVLDLVDNMTSKIKGVSGQVPESVKKMNNAFGTMQRAGTIMAGAGTAITGACLSTVTATFDTQDALAEVASLGVEDLGALETAAKNFSDTWAGTSKADFISASYDIKSGIASLTDEGVAKYTELAGLTAKATKATTEDMTSLFATGYGIYKDFYNDMSDMEFGEMFSAGIATAVKNYKTSGTQMADSIKTLGATATMASVPMEEQLAILGQLQATMPGSEAGTKYKAFLNGVSGAGEKLGLSFLDANNNLKSTPEIMDELKKKYGDTIDAVEKQQLKEAFGTDEAIAVIDLLYNSTDQLKSGIDDLKTSMDSGISTTEKMAETINDTPAQKFEVIKQKVHNAAEELGQGLLPAVNDTLDTVGDMIQKGSDWVSNNQELVSTIMHIAMYLGVFLIAAGSASAVVGTLGKMFLNFNKFGNIAMKLWNGFGKALLTSPVMWGVAAVLALVAAFKLFGGDASKAGDLVRTLFDKLSGIISNVAVSIVQFLPQFLTFGIEMIAMILDGILSGAPGLIQTLGSVLLMLAMAVLQIAPQLLTAGVQLIQMLIMGAVQNIPKIISVGISLIFNLLQGILSALPTVLSAVLQAFASIAEMIFSIDWLDVGYQIIKAIIEGLVSGITALADTAKGLFSDFKGWISGEDKSSDPVVDIASGIKSQVPDVDGAVSGINDSLSKINPDTSGVSIGKDLMDNITTDITAGTGQATAAASQASDSISEAFNINTGTPSASGIMDGIKGSIESGTSNAVTSEKGSGTQIVQGIQSVVPDARTAGGNIMQAVADGIQSRGNLAVSRVQSIAIRIRSAFANMKIKIPKPSLPYVSVSYSTVGSGGATAKVPRFSVSYHASGGILTKPTLLGMLGNVAHVGGEAGDEALLPLSTLWEKMKNIVSNVVFGGKGKEKENPNPKKSERTASIMDRISTVFTKESTESTEKTETKKSTGKSMTIHKLELNVDISHIEDLQKLKKLLDELEENDDPVFA